MDGQAMSDREELVSAWVELAWQHGFRPMTFWTLTFDEKRLGRVDPERAMSAWRWLVRYLNVAEHGKRFKQWCKHSEFGYMVAVDYSRLGAVHLHAVVDRWVDLGRLHAVWSEHWGHAWTKTIGQGEDERIALSHIVKYTVKGSGLVDFWFRRLPGTGSSQSGPTASVGQLGSVVPVKRGLEPPPSG